MAAADFTLPGNMTLVPISEIDARTDAEIVSSLCTFNLPTEHDEKNVWCYWHTGWDSMPPWTKRNVIGWVRRLDASWTIRVLDGVDGSPNNLTNFVEDSFFPEAMIQGRMRGRYAGTHCADFARLPLLILYGGIWLDVGILLVRSLDDIWDAITDPTTSYEVGGMTFEVRRGRESVINTVICARRDNELIRKWHQLFLAVWGSAADCVGLHRHPLLQHLEPYVTPTDKINCHDIIVEASAIMDYGAHVLCLERLQFLVCSDDGFNGPEYFARKMYLLPVLEEMWYYQQRTAFLGTKQLELLMTPLDCDNTGEQQYNEALAFTQDMLRDTLLLKFCHGPKGVMESSLADILDDPQFYNADTAPGTMAHYLRHGSVYFQQTRKLTPKSLVGPTGMTWHAGLFETLSKAQESSK